MLGAIIGDIAGSVHEHSSTRTKDFAFFQDGCRFTDDTVCTVAVAASLVEGGDFGEYLSDFALRYGSRGFGGMFMRWARQFERRPYGSFGNGSAMRVSPVAHFARDETELISLARGSAVVSHDHPEGVKGAEATALAIWRFRHGSVGDDVRTEVEQRFGYDLSPCVDDYRRTCVFDPTCPGTVPPAIVCALEATSFEDAVRNAISLGGDADTLACIAGSIAEARFEIPAGIRSQAVGFLNDEFRDVLARFKATIME